MIIDPISKHRASGPASAFAPDHRRYGHGQIVELAHLTADAGEHAGGVSDMILYGVLLGRDPRDKRSWIVAPADVMPIAAAEDVDVLTIGSDGVPGRLLVRLEDVVCVDDKEIRHMSIVGIVDGEQMRIVTSRAMACISGEPMIDWALVRTELDAPSGWPVSRDEVAEWVTSSVASSSERGEQLWRGIRDFVESGGPRRAHVDLNEGSQRLRFAAATPPEKVIDKSCVLAGGRRVIVRRTSRSTLLVVVDTVDDVIEVCVNGRRATPGSYGYSIDVDLVADEGFVAVAVTSSLGVTSSACFEMAD